MRAMTRDRISNGGSPLAVVLLVIGLLTATSAVAGCSSSAASGVDGTTVPVDPTDTADAKAFAFTSTITITANGFEPAQAVAVFGQQLKFVNATATPQTITFVNGSPNIGAPSTYGPIAAGASLTVPGELKTAISLVYRSDAVPGVQGRLQIDPGVKTI